MRRVLTGSAHSCFLANLLPCTVHALFQPSLFEFRLSLVAEPHRVTTPSFFNAPSTRRPLIDALFDSAVLVFTVPMLLAVLFWLLALVGLFDFEAFDFGMDVDLDAEAELDGGGALHALGLGLIPFSLMLTFLLFVFGFTGIALHTLLVSALDWSAGTATLAVLPVALIAALAVGVVVGRLLHPLFRDHGAATMANDLVGKVATLTSGSVSTTFGAATVRMDGDRIEIAARTETDTNDLGYGDRVLLLDYDAAHNLYLVAPFDDEDALPAP